MAKAEGRTVNIQATENQRRAWIAWNDDVIDDLVYGGAAGGGKTMLACFVLTGDAVKYPGTKYFLGRKELKRLMQTSFITLTQKVFPLYGLERDRDWTFDGKYNVVKFRNGSVIDLLDLDSMPSDPLFDRFGSSEYTRGWIEEASEVSFKAYDVLKSRIGRWMNKEYGIKGKLGLSLNPSQDWPYRVFYDVWNKAGRPNDPSKPLVSFEAWVNGEKIQRTFVFIPALYKDNPFTAQEYSRNLATIQDQVLKQRLMDGNWDYASAVDTLFTAQMITDLFVKRAIAHSDDMYLIVDAARLGGDEIVLNAFRGWDSFRIKRLKNLRINETATEVRTMADELGIPRENILIDEDGVGGGVLDLVPGALGFHGGASPFGKVGEDGAQKRENYDNLRSQCTYHLASVMSDRRALVSETDMDTREKIAQDLQQFKRRDAQREEVLKVTRKEDIKQALGRSPDCGDTMMMRSYFDLRLRDVKIAGQMGGTMSVHIPDYGFDDGE